MENKFGPAVRDPGGLLGTRSEYGPVQPIKAAMVVVIARSMYRN